MATKKKAAPKPATNPANAGKFHLPFPTHVHSVDFGFEGIEAFNRDLAMSLYRMRSKDAEGIFRSNMSGTWHSTDTVLRDNGAFGETLKKMFYSSFVNLAKKFCYDPHPEDVYEMKMAAWCMMYRDRGYASPHSHPNCHFSGVYYVDVGEPQEAQQLATNVSVEPGTLEFFDTRYGVGQQMVAGHNFCPSFRATPRNGRMVVFPSGLPHWVHPVKGDGERIAVACNATLTKYLPYTEK